jgi:hypothetical protein
VKNNIIAGAQNPHRENFLIDFSWSSVSFSSSLRKLGFLFEISYFPAIQMKKHQIINNISEINAPIHIIWFISEFSCCSEIIERILIILHNAATIRGEQKKIRHHIFSFFAFFSFCIFYRKIDKNSFLYYRKNSNTYKYILYF